MKVAALAGGVGAGKFLRGLVRVAEPSDLTVIVNTGDDFEVHGLHVSPDIDSVMYALAGLEDRERGWGRSGETFRATAELRERLGAEQAWFNLGDLDLALHIFRTERLRSGEALSSVTADVARRLGIGAHVLPMTDDEVATHIDAIDAAGRAMDLHFQEYWVKRRGSDEVKGVRFEGAAAARPGHGVTRALEDADLILICPSNPVVSIGPILSLPGVRDLIRGAVGISPIVEGAPLRGMADRLMPSAGLEVSAVGAGTAYRGLLSAWVIDEKDAGLAPRVERELGVRAGVTDTVMESDEKAEALARFAIGMAE